MLLLLPVMLTIYCFECITCNPIYKHLFSLLITLIVTLRTRRCLEGAEVLSLQEAGEGSVLVKHRITITLRRSENQGYSEYLPTWRGLERGLVGESLVRRGEERWSCFGDPNNPGGGELVRFLEYHNMR